jgi:hypothetical protein
MRGWLALGAAAAIVVASYAELVLDILAPRSDRVAASALAAVISFPTGEPDPPKKLAGMYGLFVVRAGGSGESLFPFSIVPGMVASSEYRPPLDQLWERFGASFPASRDAADDAQKRSNSCVSRPAAELGFGRLTEYLHLRAQASCIVRQVGPGPATMLVSVTIADADPWLRPFVRKICGRLTAAALAAIGSTARPDYAACVLVDRPGRIRPGDAQDTFATVVYELRDRALARMD